MRSTDLTQTPTHFPLSQAVLKTRSWLWLVLEVHAVWFSFIHPLSKLGYQRASEPCRTATPTSWLQAERILQRHLRAAEAQLAPDHCGAGPIFKCLHLVPPTSWLLWGWWESGCIESCWDIWLHFLGSVWLNSAPALPTVQKFILESRGKRR